MRLVSVYRDPTAPRILYDILKDRHPNENISHKKLPSFEEHKKFYYSAPYAEWYLIELESVHTNPPKIEPGKKVGSIYLTRNAEIGVHFLQEYKGRRLEKQAIQLLMLTCGLKRYFVNVSINNQNFKEIVTDLGFEPIQKTYEFINDKP